MKLTNIIHQVKIRDYGIIKSADLEFWSGLNIIVGPNASGKTTILDFIAEHNEIRDVNNMSAGEKILSPLVGLLNYPTAHTILLDDVGRLESNNLRYLLETAEKSPNVVIITLRDIKAAKGLKANIINTDTLEKNQPK